MSILSPRSALAALTACGALAAALTSPAVAPAADGQIIVRYAAGADAQERADARAAADVARDEALPLPGTELVTPDSGTSVREAVADLERSPDVLYAERDRPRAAFRAPTDPQFARQWALQNTGTIFSGPGAADFYAGTPGDDIDATRAWDAATDTTAVVAVVDSGVDLEHPDLKPNIVAGGRDFVDGDATPADENGHGTHVAGTIGAAGDNGIGVAGVAWKAPLLAIRVLDASGDGTVSNLVKGYQAAAAAGARVMNLSLGGGEPSQTEYDAIRTASNVLFVVAAGNSGADNDIAGSYPCDYDLPNVVCVAASGADDQLASFSNYGARSVDIAAPGVDILSTWPRNPTTGAAQYAWLDGTSMAAPHVSGAAALMLGARPGLTPWQVRGMLMASADPVPALAGRVASAARLDVAAALSAPVPPAAGAPAPSLVAPEPALGPAPVLSAPAAAPASSAPPVDRAAPVVRVAVPGRRALAALVAGRLRVSTRSSERANVRLELWAGARTAKRLRLSRRARAVRVATGGATLTRAGTRALALRATRAARRALVRVRSVRATLRATATDASGNVRRRTVAVTLAR